MYNVTLFRLDIIAKSYVYGLTITNRPTHSITVAYSSSIAVQYILQKNIRYSRQRI